MNAKTLAQYTDIVAHCKEVFEKKTTDYGTAWRILRLPSLTDQIMIKARRIRFLQETKEQRISEGIETEFIGIINYCIMALMQIHFEQDANLHLSYDTLSPLYEKIVQENLTLLQHKNHDYQEAWRGMRLTSITDIILMKLLRTQQIENNQGETLISEGVKANYQDIINYAVFALIKLEFLLAQKKEK